MSDYDAPEVIIAKVSAMGMGGAADELGILPKFPTSASKVNLANMAANAEKTDEANKSAIDTPTLHGDSAALRRAVTELLFFASVGDIGRCKEIVSSWSLKVSDVSCSDYDKRTPLHLSAREGAWAVSKWLIEAGADINAVDRFQRTPLEEAVRGSQREIVQLLVKQGGLIYEDKSLVPVEQSALATPGGRMLLDDAETDIWEIDRNDLVMHEVLGEGEFGIVHRATYHGTDVAVKILKVSHGIALEDFRTEISTLRQVHHPNAVQFLGACTKKNPYMLVTELMYGGSLADCFKLVEYKTRPISLRRALELALDAARGMNYLHMRNPNPIIHRDLKPGNFMVTGSSYSTKNKLTREGGVLKIADFGLCKTMPTRDIKGDLHTASDKYKMTGETGTYRYMAPEVFRHEPYDTKVDVYAFSMCLYELFEGRPPFEVIGGIAAAKAASFDHSRPIMLAMDKPGDKVRTSIKQLVESMWAPDPADRPTFQLIVNKLQVLLKQTPPEAAATPCCSIQ